MFVDCVPVLFIFVVPRIVLVAPFSANAPVVLPMLVARVEVVFIFVIPNIVCVPLSKFVVPSMVFVEPLVPILTPPPFRPIKTAPVVDVPFPIRISPLLEPPFPISIAPLLLLSLYKDTDVPTAVPVIVFVITEVRVDAAALKAPAIAIFVAVIVLPSKETVVAVVLPMVMVFVDVPFFPICISPVLPTSSYKDTAVPTAVP